MDKEYDYDIVVIGCGAAGSAASLSALQAAKERGKDISLLIVERADPSNRGGNSRWTGAFLRMESETEIADNFVQDMLTFSKNKSNKDYIDKLAELAPGTIEWVKEYGVRFRQSRDSFITVSKPRLLPVAGGVDIVDNLLAGAETLGAQIIYESTAWKLSIDSSGRIDGIWLRGNDGNSVKVTTKAVILSSGGFEGNPEMLTAYIGKGAANLRTIAKGGLYNKGEGIKMAVEIGAKTTGQFDEFHAEPIDPRASFKIAEPLLMVHPYGILIDKYGHRFMDEGIGTVDETYESVARAIFQLPDQIAYFISDGVVSRIPNFDTGLGSKIEPIKADTIEEIAREIDVPEDELKKTIEEFNKSTNEGDYDPTRLDHKGTRNVTPSKSNWAMPITEPPFIAYPIACSIVFTFGGLSVDLESRVVSNDDVPIPGLYAAGEITGLYYSKYPGATSVLRGMTFGKIAGSSALKYVLNEK